VTLIALELDMLEKRDLVVAFLIGAFAFGLGFLWPISAFSKQIDAVSQGTLIAHDQVTGLRSELPRLSTKVEINVTGPIARARVTQRFVNPTDNWTEALYAFPLPENAAVDTLHMVIGDRVVVGEIKEKGEARKVYEEAKTAGKQTALVEQHRPNLFSTGVANIPPKGNVEIKIEYQQRLEWKDERFSLRFPMTVTPRYVPQNKLPPTSIVRSEERISGGWQVLPGELPQEIKTTEETSDPSYPEHTVSLVIHLDPGFPLERIRSLYHPVEFSKRGDITSVTLRNKEVKGDRDFVLEWRNAERFNPTAAFFTEQTADGDYGLLMVLPPQLMPGKIPARDLTFIIDTSGSMGGTSISQAKSALMAGLRGLTSGDTFNLVEFNSNASSLFTAPRLATPQNLEIAESWVDQLEANGGTEILAAFKKALALATSNKQRLQQIVFLTDGAVGNEEDVFRFIRANLDDQRLFMVGIGSAPNSYFMVEAAHFGRGTFTNIGDISEITERMKALFDLLKRPVLTDIKLTTNGMADLTPNIIPDLYAGGPVVVAMKLDPGERQLGIVGRLGSTEWRKTLDIKSGVPNSGIRINWAREWIKQWMRARVTGFSSDEVKEKVTELALKHHLVSPYTSLVAVDKTPVRPAEAQLSSKAIKSERPAGLKSSSIAMAQTALGIEWRILLGLLLVGLAGLFWMATRRHERAFQG
jgi:Ca-activated chloride channel family protein